MDIRRGGLSQVFERVEGIDQLANMIEKLMLTTLGSDAENPNAGCYLKSFVGQNMSDIEDAVPDIDQEVRRVEKYVINEQSRMLQQGADLDRNTLLRSLDMTKIKVNQKNGSMKMTYRIITRGGEGLERELFSE